MAKRKAVVVDAQDRVSFDCDYSDRQLINRVVDRAMAPVHSGTKASRAKMRSDLLMDITAVHCNGTPLRLYDWLECPDDFNFLHDIYGIQRHIDRTTGGLTNHFRPRFAARKAL